MKQVQILQVFKDSLLLYHLMHPSTEHQLQQMIVDWGIALIALTFALDGSFCRLLYVFVNVFVPTST